MMKDTNISPPLRPIVNADQTAPIKINMGLPRIKEITISGKILKGTWNTIRRIGENNYRQSPGAGRQ
mgnify:CR=1 FL=1